VTRKILPIVLLSASLALVGAPFAQKAAVPRQIDKLALADEHAMELLLLMDTDKKGKISKQEWMKFMEAEFDRLDQDKTGELDPKLVQSKLVKHAPVNTGK
jgi:EF hand